MTGAQFVEVMLQPKLDDLGGWKQRRCRRPADEEWAGDGTPEGHALARSQAATAYYADTAQLAQELYAILTCWEPLIVRAPARALLTFRECATLDIAAGSDESEDMARTALAACNVTLAWLAKEGELGENAAAEDPCGPDAAAGLGLHPE